jgi:hypothetical protein
MICTTHSLLNFTSTISVDVSVWIGKKILMVKYQGGNLFMEEGWYRWIFFFDAILINYKKQCVTFVINKIIEN